MVGMVFFLTREIEKRARFHSLSLSLSFFLKRSVLHLPGGGGIHTLFRGNARRSGAVTFYLAKQSPKEGRKNISC